MQSHFVRSALAVSCFAASCAYAQTPLEEVTIVSSRVQMPLRQVGTSISVVSKQELQIRGFDGLANALRYEPGIAVNNNGGAGKATALRIRGERDFRTKVFIDGIEVTDTSTPQAGPNFAHITNAAIERVEILRGPQGMMYGADAGGVVAISTLAPRQGLTGGVSAEYGRYATSDFQGYLAGGSDSVDFALSASSLDTDGFNARDDDTDLRDDDGYENTTLHGRAGWEITDSLRLQAVARYVEGDNEYDDCTDAVTFDRLDDCTNEHDELAWRAAFEHRTATLTNTIAYNLHHSEREFFSAGTSSFETEGDLEEISYLGSWKAREGLGFTYGAELRKESIEDGSSDTNRDQSGYFAEYQGSFNNTLFFTAGARFDDNDDFGSETTYRVSAAYLLGFGDGELKFKSAFGTGFRAPSLSEISYNSGPFAEAPASETDLSAEESQGYDLGVGYFANSGWTVELTYFDQTIDNEIYFDLVDFSGYLQGGGESTSKGVELVTQLPLSDSFTVLGNYTYNDTEDTEGEQRVRAPKHLGNLGLRFSPWGERLVLNLNLRVSHDSPAERNGEVDDYELLDLSASYQLIDSLEIFGRVENLTDENYQELPNYNTSGAAAYVGVRYTFTK